MGDHDTRPAGPDREGPDHGHEGIHAFPHEGFGEIAERHGDRVGPGDSLVTRDVEADAVGARREHAFRDDGGGTVRRAVDVEALAAHAVDVVRPARDQIDGARCDDPVFEVTVVELGDAGGILVVEGVEENGAGPRGNGTENERREERGNASEEGSVSPVHDIRLPRCGGAIKHGRP